VCLLAETSTVLLSFALCSPCQGYGARWAVDAGGLLGAETTSPPTPAQPRPQAPAPANAMGVPGCVVAATINDCSTGPRQAAGGSGGATAHGAPPERADNSTAASVGADIGVVHAAQGAPLLADGLDCACLPSDSSVADRAATPQQSLIIAGELMMGAAVVAMAGREASGNSPRAAARVTFRGFLEPQMQDGHAQGWRH
jgi:hypothetical protein